LAISAVTLTAAVSSNASCTAAAHRIDEAQPHALHHTQGNEAFDGMDQISGKAGQHEKSHAEQQYRATADTVGQGPVSQGSKAPPTRKAVMEVGTQLLPTRNSRVTCSMAGCTMSLAI
jgi:hypothetical protein